jgi:chromosome segregation ATPase
VLEREVACSNLRFLIHQFSILSNYVMFEFLTSFFDKIFRRTSTALNSHSNLESENFVLRSALEQNLSDQKEEEKKLVEEKKLIERNIEKLKSETIELDLKYKREILIIEENHTRAVEELERRISDKEAQQVELKLRFEKLAIQENQLLKTIKSKENKIGELQLEINDLKKVIEERFLEFGELNKKTKALIVQKAKLEEKVASLESSLEKKHELLRTTVVKLENVKSASEVVKESGNSLDFALIDLSIKSEAAISKADLEHNRKLIKFDLNKVSSSSNTTSAIKSSSSTIYG